MKRLSITMLMLLTGVVGLACFVSLALSGGPPDMASVELDALIAEAPARIASVWYRISLPHPAVVAACLAGLLVLIGAYYGCRTASQCVNEKKRKADEALLKEEVANKARRSVAAESPGSERLLSQSGVFSLLDVIDTCVANGHFEQALQWTRHAIQASPGAYEFEVKLAEVYYKMGDLAGFLPLTQELHQKLHESHPELWEKIVRMGSELIPMHPLFRVRNSAKAGK